MQFRLLGPLEVAEQNMAAALGGVKQCSTLPILVIVRLEELRRAAPEERIDADLADGRRRDLVGELGALIVAHPLRVRLRAQLMPAVYGSGRQAEALHAYRATRGELADERGAEPGEEPRRFEQAILVGAIGTRVASAPPPTVLVTRGAGLAGLAPNAPGTRSRWSLTGAGS